MIAEEKYTSCIICLVNKTIYFIPYNSIDNITKNDNNIFQAKNENEFEIYDTLLQSMKYSSQIEIKNNCIYSLINNMLINNINYIQTDIKIVCVWYSKEEGLIFESKTILVDKSIKKNHHLCLGYKPSSRQIVKAILESFKYG